MNIVISNATIITMDQDRRILYDSAIAIDGNKILEVGPNEELLEKYPNYREINAKGKIVSPGFVNTHTHLFQGLLKGLADDCVLVDWFRNVTGPSAVHLSQDDCYQAARLGCLESIKSGATTLVDFMYPHNQPNLSDPIIKAFCESGIRGIFARGFIDYGLDSGVPEEIIEDADTALEDAKRLFLTYNGMENGRIHVWVAPCMIWTQTEDGLIKTRKLANELNMRISMHVAETPYELQNSLDRFKLKDLEYLASINFLGPDVLIIHGVYLDKHDIRIMKKLDVKLSHNAISNMYLSSGVAPVPDLLMAGVTVGLATDGPASNNNQNMLHTLKYTALLHKVATKDPTVITAEKVLEMATIEGARAVGLENEIGSIEVGKKADIIILDFHNAFSSPTHNPVSTMVYSSCGNEVETVLIDGNIVMENGVLSTLDEDDILLKAQEAADLLSKRAGTEKYKRREWKSLAY